MSQRERDYGQSLAVTCPAGAAAGGWLQVLEPGTGRPLRVQVPPGVGPGQVHKGFLPVCGFLK